MSGHSKWATTKHKKAVVDARRGKLFARLIKNIEVAARQGGGDPAGNPTLYDAIQKARKNSVPLDNIERAVKRGSGAEAGGAGTGSGARGQVLMQELASDEVAPEDVTKLLLEELVRRLAWSAAERERKPHLFSHGRTIDSTRVKSWTSRASKSPLSCFLSPLFAIQQGPLNAFPSPTPGQRRQPAQRRSGQ